MAAPGRPLGRDAVVAAVLAAAAELFAEKGPAATSVRDIAARSGVNHGLVYRHFGAKEQLVGAVLDYLSRVLNIPPAEIATIGDQPNDVLMFKRSGFSIAMGNASDQVKAQASASTASYNDEGFAKAMEQYILGMEA